MEPEVRRLPTINESDSSQTVKLKQAVIDADNKRHQAKLLLENDAEAPDDYLSLVRAHKSAQRKVRQAWIKLDALTDPELAAKLEAQRQRRNETKKRNRQALEEKAKTDPAAFLKLQKQKEAKKQSNKVRRKKVSRKKKERKANNARYHQHKKDVLEGDDLTELLNLRAGQIEWRTRQMWFSILKERAAQGDLEAQAELAKMKKPI